MIWGILIGIGGTLVVEALLLLWLARAARGFDLYGDEDSERDL